MHAKKNQILQTIPWADVIETLDSLAESGWDKDAAIELVAGLLDEALPFDTLVPGPTGVALEAVDGPVLRATLGLLWSLAQHKQGRAARKARRLARQHAA